MAGDEVVWALPSGLMYPGCAKLAVLHSRIWLKAEASGSWMEGACSTNIKAKTHMLLTVKPLPVLEHERPQQ